MNLLGIKKDRVSCLRGEIRKIQFRLNKISNPRFVIAFHLFCTVERKLRFQCFFNNEKEIFKKKHLNPDSSKVIEGNWEAQSIIRVFNKTNSFPHPEHPNNPVDKG
jgi:hypothetical protein